MANFRTNIQVDTTGNAPSSEEQPVTIFADPQFARLQFDGYYVDMTGSFTFGPGNEVTGIRLVSMNAHAGLAPQGLPDYFTDPQQYGEKPFLTAFNVFHLTYDPAKLLTLTGVALAKYQFRDRDGISGSPFADKLAGWAKRDEIFGGAGNDEIYGGKARDEIYGGSGRDELWGGGGDDIFHFNEGYDKDRILDFRQGDFIYVDRDLARNMRQLREFADQQGSKVVFKFGDGDKLIVDGLDIDGLNRFSFGFAEVEV
jgi:hypothetical protein